jgi:hypothetical protein
MHFNFLPSVNTNVAGVKTSEYSTMLVPFNTASGSSKTYATFGKVFSHRMWNKMVFM